MNYENDKHSLLHQEYQSAMIEVAFWATIHEFMLRNHLENVSALEGQNLVDYMLAWESDDKTMSNYFCTHGQLVRHYDFEKGHPRYPGSLTYAVIGDSFSPKTKDITEATDLAKTKSKEIFDYENSFEVTSELQSLAPARSELRNREIFFASEAHWHDVLAKAQQKEAQLKEAGNLDAVLAHIEELRQRVRAAA